MSRLRLCALWSVLMVLVACGGVPLRSLPRLVHLQEELLTGDPAEFAVAIAVDARMTPPPGSAPFLVFRVAPGRAGAFEAIDRRLPMEFATAAGATQGLPHPGRDRRWLVYRLGSTARTEILELRRRWTALQASGATATGGTISLGLEQDGVAARDPAFADTLWESWLRTSRREGYYALWSGTVGELIAQADKRR